MAAAGGISKGCFCLDVRLFFIVGSDNHLPLLPHFLEHWITRLGMNPTRVYPDIHTAATERRVQKEKLGKAMEILSEFGVPKNNTAEWIGPFNSITRKERFKKRWVKVRRSILGPRESPFPRHPVWIAIADADEFPILAPSETLERKLGSLSGAGYNMLAGITVDRMASNGSLAIPNRNSPLEEQFPLKCNVTAVCEKCIAQKTVAYLGIGEESLDWDSRKGGHHTVSFHGKKGVRARCEPVRDWIEVAHFKWWGLLEKYLEFRRQNQDGGRNGASGMLSAFTDRGTLDVARFCRREDPGGPIDAEFMAARELERQRPQCLDLA